MTKKIFSLVTASLFLFLISVGLSSFAYGEKKSLDELLNELEEKTEEFKKKADLIFAFKPNIFRDIEWGTPIEKCYGMIFLASSRQHKFYERKEKRLKIGPAEIETEIFGFYKNQLMSIRVATRGKKNFENLRQIAFGEFDEGIQFDESVPEWFWVDILGGGVRLLKYDKSLQEGTFYLLSVEIYNQWKKASSTVQRLQRKPEWSQIIRWQGSGIKTTEPFKIKGSMWRIKWQNLSQVLQIYVYRLNGDLVTLPVNTLEKGQDISYIYEKGEFYLTINAMGKWVIQIEEKGE